MVPLAIHAQISEDVALYVEQCRVGALTRSQPLNVIRQHVMQQGDMVRACGGKAGTKGEIEEPCRSADGLMFGDGIGKTGRHDGTVVFAQSSALCLKPRRKGGAGQFSHLIHPCLRQRK